MANPKTLPTDQDVHEFLDGIADEKKRRDAYDLLALMQQVTGEAPRMWGESIVGFGQYHYEYKSGHTGTWPLVGFSPRKQNLTLYLMTGFDGYDDLMSRLGKYKTSVACLYLKKLADVDQAVLRELVQRCAEHMRHTYPTP